MEGASLALARKLTHHAKRRRVCSMLQCGIGAALNYWCEYYDKVSTNYNFKLPAARGGVHVMFGRRVACMCVCVCARARVWW